MPLVMWRRSRVNRRGVSTVTALYTKSDWAKNMNAGNYLDLKDNSPMGKPWKNGLEAGKLRRVDWWHGESAVEFNGLTNVQKFALRVLLEPICGYFGIYTVCQNHVSRHKFWCHFWWNFETKCDQQPTDNVVELIKLNNFVCGWLTRFLLKTS